MNTDANRTSDSRVSTEVSPAHYVTMDELVARRPGIQASPQDHGPVQMLLVRPEVDRRLCPLRVDVSPAGGVHGDRWQATCRRRLPDGSPDPVVQVTLINTRCIMALTGDRSRWALAGDNLFVDLNLSLENLPAGTWLRVGSAILEITALPHNGCVKFERRFGPAALQFVNAPEGKAHRLRGAHARVVQAGSIQVGDIVQRIPGSTR